MSKNIVFEGWLTKSPPSTRIWKTKWRRRWFALRQSGELPGQYFLDYYADCNCRRFKGTINLDFCEQVDAGLHTERNSNCSVKPKLRGSVFTIQTQNRTYHLEADCEAEMEKWVDAICRVCGLRATDDTTNASEVFRNRAIAVNSKDTKSLKKTGTKPKSSAHARTINNSHNTVSRNVQQQRTATKSRTGAIRKTTYMNEYAKSTGPYIPISECITGARTQETTFTFDTNNIVVHTRTKLPTDKNIKKRQITKNKPQIRINNKELSGNESNVSEEEYGQSRIGDKSLSRRLKKLSLVPQENNILIDDVPPPVPPRPLKTLTLGNKDTFQGPKIQESCDITPSTSCACACAMSRGATPPSPGRPLVSHSTIRTTDDEDEAWASTSMQYCNLSSIPPAVDRALKPRISSHSIGNVSNISSLVGQAAAAPEPRKRDVLQYLDLDLPPSTLTPVSKSANIAKSASSESESAYKTVDFVRTEAFNSTRADAEAFREAQL